MPLCTPTLVGPVSELSPDVRVQGALQGATVIISSVGKKPRDVAKAKANGGDDRIPLLATEKLSRDDILVVMQTLGSDKSAVTPQSMGLGVQPAPASAAELGAPGFLSHLYQCGQHVWLQGVVPGATVEVEFGGAVQGSATATEEGARIGLKHGLPKTGQISARQKTPVGSGTAASATPDPLPFAGGTVPAPTIRKPPLLACQTAALVTDVFDGATVTLSRSTGITEVAGFDLPSLWFGLSKPLKENETITARQDFPGCELKGATGKSVTVDKAAALDKPFVPPLCAGSQRVTVFNLAPGATVHLDIAGTSYLGMAPLAQSWVAFDVDPLLANGKLVAGQELCGVKGPSFTVDINPHEDVKTPVTLLDPLYECARVIKVSNAHPNAYLQAWATDKQKVAAPISGVVLATATDVTLHVSPYLRAGDMITVRQWACSAVWTESNPPIKVQQHPSVGLPKIVGPVYSGDISVKVDCIPGALVEVSVLTPDKSWAFAGAGDAAEVPASIALNCVLATGQQVRARQWLCALVSDWSAGEPVIRPLPQAPVIDAPANGATAVALNPTFSWHDPGAGGEGHADGYKFTLLRDATTIVPLTTVNATSFAAPSPLVYETTYTWQVSAANTSGPSKTTTASFTTLKAPPPPPPVLTSYDWNTKTLKGTGFLHSHAVHVRINLYNSSITNSYGAFVSDTREVYVNCTSDAQGNLSVVINPNDYLPALYLDNIVGYFTGVAPGETLNISANDERPDKNDDITGTLWSNTLHVLVPQA